MNWNGIYGFIEERFARFQLEQFNSVFAENLSGYVVPESQIAELFQALFPGQAVCSPETSIAAQAAIDELNDLR